MGWDRGLLAALTLAGVLGVPGVSYAALPGQPASVAAAVGAGRALVTWEPSSDDGGLTATGYEVYRVIDGGAPEPVASLGADARSYSDTAMPVGPQVSYGVAQRNADGTGEAVYTAPQRGASGEVLVTTPRISAPGDRRVDAQVPGAAARFPVAGEAGIEYDEPAASPDGREVAYSRRDAGGNTDLWIANADGTGSPRRLTQAQGMDYAAAWSPDGRMIAFVRNDSLWVIPAAGGAAVKVRDIGLWPAWLSDSRTLLVSAQWAVLRLRPGSKEWTALPRTANAEDLAVSPNGRWLAYTYQGAHGRRALAITPVDGSAPPKVFTDPVADTFEPTWRGDGRALYASRIPDSDEDAWQVASFSWDGSTLTRAAAAVTTGEDDHDPAYRAIGLGFTTAPYATKTTATVLFELSGPYATATCRLDGGAATICSSGQWTKAGLAQGRHTLVVTATAAGYPSRVLAHTWSVDLSAPVVAPEGLPRTVSLGSTAHFGYSATDDGAGVASYDVRYRRAPHDGPFGPYVSPQGWLGRTEDWVLISGPTAGYEYCFSVRARDRIGNVSAWSAERCWARPLDDTVFSASPSWARLSSGSYYGGSAWGTSARGARVTLAKASASTLTLVATRCPACGTIAVWHAGVRVATFDLAGSVTEYRVRLTTPYRALRSGPVTVEVTSSGKPVRVDGIAALRK